MLDEVENRKFENEFYRKKIQSKLKQILMV